MDAFAAYADALEEASQTGRMTIYTTRPSHFVVAGSLAKIRVLAEWMGAPDVGALADVLLQKIAGIYGESFVLDAIHCVLMEGDDEGRRTILIKHGFTQ